MGWLAVYCVPLYSDALANRISEVREVTLFSMLNASCSMLNVKRLVCMCLLSFWLCFMLVTFNRVQWRKQVTCLGRGTVCFYRIAYECVPLYHMLSRRIHRCLVGTLYYHSSLSQYHSSMIFFFSTLATYNLSSMFRPHDQGWPHLLPTQFIRPFPDDRFTDSLHGSLYFFRLKLGLIYSLL